MMLPNRFRRVPSLFATSLILFIIGILLFLALLTGNRELIVLSIIVFGIVGGLKIWAKYSSTNVKSLLELEKNRVFAGDRLFLRAIVENGKALPVWLEVLVSIDNIFPVIKDDVSLTGQGSLLWYQRTTFEWSIATMKRGVCAIGPLILSSGDLFGFFEKESQIGRRVEAVVYPKLIALGRLSLPRRDFFGNPGGESPVDDPVYILGTTDYQNGRPAKYIHWKASARHHRLQEKVFESTEQEKILLVIDVQQFIDPERESDFESILEVVASVAVRLEAQGSAMGLFTNGDTYDCPPVVSISRSPQQVTAILEAIARLRRSTHGSLIDLLTHLDIPWGTSCLYFT
ncbi:MAG TPA: DUF58 domain-containing protein, partial [Syntrophorhabdaceae bacterium]|nr:DUF58 domain-containing protein [Syntrophorhabdaceae bacterium]